jgi:hypothetical protein
MGVFHLQGSSRRSIQPTGVGGPFKAPVCLSSNIPNPLAQHSISLSVILGHYNEENPVRLKNPDGISSAKSMRALTGIRERAVEKHCDSRSRARRNAPISYLGNQMSLIYSIGEGGSMETGGCGIRYAFESTRRLRASFAM